MTIFGELGCGNFGNDGSLSALLDKFSAVHPSVSIKLVGYDAGRLERDFHLPASLMRSTRESHPFEGWPQLWGKVARRIADVCLSAKQARDADVIIIPGAGPIEGELGTRWHGLAWSLLRLGLAAKLMRTRIAYVSVGVSWIHEPFSRLMFLSALRLADYRSYRDELSRQSAYVMGLDVSKDPVHADLAFSLTVPPCREPSFAPGARVALGLMHYEGRNDDPLARTMARERYLAGIVDFGGWLDDHGYKIVLVGGDEGDTDSIELVAENLAARGVATETPPVRSLTELIEIFADVDFVVATRFHNIVCGLMTARPTISISYARKNTYLLTKFGLGEFSQDIDELDVRHLAIQFGRLSSSAERYLPGIRREADAARESVEAQFGELLALLRKP